MRRRTTGTANRAAESIQRSEPSVPRKRKIMAVQAAATPKRPLERARKTAQSPRFLQPKVATTSGGIKARAKMQRENNRGKKI